MTSDRTPRSGAHWSGHLWVDVAQDRRHQADDHLETRRSDRVTVFEECETQKPRSIGNAALPDTHGASLTEHLRNLRAPVRET